MRRLIFSWLLFLFFTLPVYAEQLIIEPDMGRAPILNAINESKYSLQLVMYGLTDQTLLHALIRQRTLGRTVQILLEQTPYKAEAENTNAIRALETANVPWHGNIPSMRLIHQKTLIIDKRKALVMTFNFTQSTFKKARNFGLLLDNPEEVADIVSHFSADWNHQPVVSHASHLLWSPDDSQKKLTALILHAEHSIAIYTQNISDFKLVGALAKVARKGVSVTILTSNKLRQKQLGYLTHAGVKIRMSNGLYIHAKVFIIDNEKAIIGSINMTRASLNDNRELSVLTENREVVRQLRETFDSDWREADAGESSWKIDKHVLLRVVKLLERYL